MRFTLDGDVMELTAQQVRDRLAGQVPEDVRSYWVEVDGRRWPVKQVVALATGASRDRFQSQSSQRWLKNLGFEVGGLTAPRSDSSADLVAELSVAEVLGAVDIRVAFSWLRAGNVTLDDNGFPRFPVLPSVPGLYRFDFGLDARGIRTLYVGESVDVARRASNYRNAKSDRSRQRTSRRIHREVVDHLSRGGLIEFAIATDAYSGDDDSIDLRLKSARRLAENAAVLLAQTRADTRVLNIDAEL